jgi:2,4-didehydro-3-deoxy-L-rhamnonate hydrolase
MPQETFHLGAFERAGQATVGLVLEDSVVDLNAAVARLGGGLPTVAAVADLLEDWDRNFEALLRLAESVLREGVGAFGAQGLAETRPLPPLGRRSRQLYAAANYREHVAGMRKTFTPAIPLAGGEPPEPEAPYLFGKMCDPTGAFDDIVLPSGMQRIDWEAELMVVAGRPGRNIPEEKITDHIAGYMATNDVSCRDRTWRLDRPGIRSDWVSGKSFDSFAPMGPFFTPKAFVPNHADLAIRCWVNGVLKQDGNTRDMVFGIESQLAYASRLMTLRPGDVFATGTPAGTGQERLEFLAVGDIVETEVDFCGRLRNAVVAGPADYVN